MGAEGFRGGEHQDAAEAVALEAGHHADLRGVTDAGGNFAGQDRPGEFLALRMMQDEGSVRKKLAAAGEQDDVLQEFQRAVPSAVLVVDVAVDVIRVGEVNQLGARLEVALVPAVEPQAGVHAGDGVALLLQVEQHELPCVQPETLVAQRGIHRPAEGHKLRFDAVQLRQGAHAEQHLVQQAPADRLLHLAGRNVESADQTFVIFEHVKRIADRVPAFKCHAAGKRVGIQESLDQVECAAVIPMEFVTPMAGFLKQQRLKLADSRLAEVDDIHRKGPVCCTPAHVT